MAGIKVSWKDPFKELPELGDKIWCLGRHWKMNFPGSFRIFAGTFETSNDGTDHRVCTDDDYGEGGWSLEWPTNANKSGGEIVYAWAEASKLNIPQFVFDEREKEREAERKFTEWMCSEEGAKCLQDTFEKYYGDLDYNLKENNPLKDLLKEKFDLKGSQADFPITISFSGTVLSGDLAYSNPSSWPSPVLTTDEKLILARFLSRFLWDKGNVLVKKYVDAAFREKYPDCA